MDKFKALKYHNQGDYKASRSKRMINNMLYRGSIDPMELPIKAHIRLEQWTPKTKLWT